ncbi:MAG: DUF58 domain-containing protein [Cyanobacteria bacterium J06629_19]
MNRLIYRLLRLSHVLKRWLGQQLTPNGIVLLVGLFIFGLIGLDIKRSLSYQMFIFLLAIFAVSILFSRLSRYRLTAVRKLPRLGTVGVPLSYPVLVSNRRGKSLQGLALRECLPAARTFPSFQAFRRAMMRDSWRMRKRSAGSSREDWFRLLSRYRRMVAPAIALPPLAAKSEIKVTGEILPLRRGLLRLQTLTLACPDPLGLVNRCVSFSQPQSVLILPKRYQLPVIDLPGSRRHQADSSALGASIGDSQEFRSLREYRPGDSPRKIHWKSWAKLGKPVIREEQTEFSVRHTLILDTFQADDYSDVLEEAVAIAASLSCTVQTQESLLDTVFVSGQAHCFTVGHGQGQTQQLLELLASVVPCQDQPFESLLTVVKSRLSMVSGCICVLLDWDSDRKALIEQLQAANIPTLVLIVSAESGLTETPERSCLKNSQSSLHVLTLDEIQEGLLRL